MNIGHLVQPVEPDPDFEWPEELYWVDGTGDLSAADVQALLADIPADWAKPSEDVSDEAEMFLAEMSYHDQGKNVLKAAERAVRESRES